MTVEFERWAIELLAAGSKIAEKLTVTHAPLHREPAMHADGHPVIGYGRRLRDYPLTNQEAEFLLRGQLRDAKSEITIRILETCAVAPLTPARVAVLLVLATIIGARRLVDWQPLWEALKLSDYNRAVMEVMRCNLLRILGDTGENQLRLVELLSTLLSGQVPGMRN